jgi:hypothetical protein
MLTSDWQRTGGPSAYSGLRCQLVYARAGNGSYPAKQFFDSLPEKVKYQFAVLFKKLGDTGTLFNKERYDVGARAEFLAIKCGRYGILCQTADAETMVLICGCKGRRAISCRDALLQAGIIYGEQIASGLTEIV